MTLSELIINWLYSIERDAQLLANRIALLKQEEMKTWKKIEETKKRTTDITTLKKRNEEKVQKVSPSAALTRVENLRHPAGKRAAAPHVAEQLRHRQAAPGREKEGAGRAVAAEEGGGQAVQDGQGAERAAQAPEHVPARAGKQNEEPDRLAVQAPRANENRGRATTKATAGAARAPAAVPGRGAPAPAEDGRGLANGEAGNGAHQAIAEHSSYLEGGILGAGEVIRAAIRHAQH